MHDQREWETLLHPGQTLGPLHPKDVAYAWGRVLAQGVELERLTAYAITADGRTTYLTGPHREDGPRGFRVKAGRTSLDGSDERGRRVQLGRLVPALVDIYLFISEEPEERRWDQYEQWR